MSTAIARKPASRNVWWRRARRLSQAATLLLFLYLLLWTRQGAERLPAYSLCFRLDPLVGLAATLAARRWIAGLALGVLTVALTLVAGRAWCGWICPLGTLLDLAPSRRARAGQDLGATWRAIKYGILALIVAGGLAGSITLMVLDPIALLTRAVASFVLPLADALIHAIEVALLQVEPLSDAVIAFDGWLRSTVLGLDYQAIDERYAVAEFTYRVRRGHRQRMVVIREKLEPDERNKQQLRLLEAPGYAYQIIATNAPESWSGAAVWRFYNHRSCLENIIKECKQDFGGDHILSSCWEGNRLWLALAVLAYNLWNWFREKILHQRAHRRRTQWLRKMLIQIPAYVTHGGRQTFLNIWRGSPGWKWENLHWMQCGECKLRPDHLRRKGGHLYGGGCRRARNL